MKIASYRVGDRETYGVVKLNDDSVSDLRKVLPPTHRTLRDVLALNALDEVRNVGRERKDYVLDEITFLPVIPNPDKILAVALNYDDHIAETGRDKTANPAWFIRVAASQVGHQQPVIMPKVSDNLDFECELAAIIGKGGHAIPVEEALEHVAGYSCYLDGSVRDWQRHTRQITAGKNFNSTGGFGPWMVTTDSIPDPQVLDLSTRLNGRVMQHGNTKDMVFSVAELIAYCSTWTTLEPGDVIVTGTPGGVGFKRNPPVFMQVGDVVEIDVEKIGTLTHRIEREL